MKKRTKISQNPSADPLYLASSAVRRVIEKLPKGTAYFIGVVLIAMMSGRLVQSKGSLARATLPFVWQIKWGWHRVERAMQRGKFLLDAMFESMNEWCWDNLPVEAVRLGSEQREVMAVDSSTIARLRSGKKLAWAGKGYWQKAAKAVRANIVAVASSIVLISGIRVGLVRRVHFGASCEAAIEKMFSDLPNTDSKRLIVVDAGIATKEQFALATPKDALLGRLRRNAKLRTAPGPRNGESGRFPLHGDVVHPGRDNPEVEPEEDFLIAGEKGEIRIRRWSNLHYEGFAHTLLDVVRVDDPTYPNKPLLIATTATELTSLQMRVGYSHRWPVETNFFVGQDTTAMDMPRAWTQLAVERRIGLALLTASLLQAIAAVCKPIAIGPWDRNPQPSAGRLAYFLDCFAHNFADFALIGVAPRNYSKISEPSFFNKLQRKAAA